MNTPFRLSNEKTPKYTVKEVAEIVNLSSYTIRYYENTGLIPNVDRSDGNIRLFSDYNLNWLKLVHCLRATGLSIEGVKRYIDMCQQGDSTIPERAEIIFKQEKILSNQIKLLKKQMEVLKYKKKFYQNLLATGQKDPCNPKNQQKGITEPTITPHAK